MAICTKQSIGVTLAVVTVIYKLLFVENKEQFREYIKIALTRILGIILPIIILIIYLIVTGAISEFINYAVLGIKTFSNKISYFGLLESDKIEIKILSVLVPLSIIVAGIILIITNIMKKENEKINKLLTMLIYSLSIIIVMYPISDEIHFIIGSIIAIIGIIYMIGLLSEKIYNKIPLKAKYKTYKIITLLIGLSLFVVISVKGFENIYNYIKVEKNTDIAHYKNVEVWEQLRQRIGVIDDYILEKEKEGKKVYILDADAAIHMIPINKYNKDYDMFLKGNIGKDGEQGQIEKIKQKDENTMYMIRNEKISTNWQTPLDVIKYIRENLEKVEEIEIYEVYK